MEQCYLQSKIKSGSSIAATPNLFKSIALVNTDKDYPNQFNDTQGHPWLNGNGSEKSLDEISEICKEWSCETWEDYLKTLEISQSEKNLNKPDLIESFIHDESHSMADLIIETKEFPQMRSFLSTSIKKLKKLERESIEGHYLGGLSQSDVANKIGVHRSTVHRAISRGLRQLKSIVKTELQTRTKVVAACETN